jgi:hypothetical protein
MQYAVGCLYEEIHLEYSNIENSEEGRTVNSSPGEKIEVLSSRYSDKRSVSKDT